MFEVPEPAEENGVHASNLWRRLLGVDSRTVIRSVGIEVDGDDDEIVVARVRVRRRDQGRCPVCRRRCPRYDCGEGERRWRTLDLGTVKAFLVADAPRVRCRRHGVKVAWVPWARHDAGFTRAFDDTVAWLATHCSQKAVEELMRIAWRTVGSIVKRVVAEASAATDRLEGLRRIGIDEISHRRGHRYLTVVVDHDTGRLLWAAPGRDEATLERFFDLLGEERAAKLTLVTADAASWYIGVIDRRAPNATRTMDPFHVTQVRHEAPCIRGRVRDPPLRSVAADR